MNFESSRECINKEAKMVRTRMESVKATDRSLRQRKDIEKSNKFKVKT